MKHVVSSDDPNFTIAAVHNCNAAGFIGDLAKFQFVENGHHFLDLAGMGIADG